MAVTLAVAQSILIPKEINANIALHLQYMA